MPDVLNSHITKTPGICGGKACIAGHRIRVADIVVWHERRGYSADEVVQFFPGLSLAEIHAALSYYFDHRVEIDAELTADETLANHLGNRPSKLREKLGN
jgi:uncharacterized protein (DUF433 family)